jgi:RNA polymerase-interacting CarD/CdnL/TRCF family regulator
MDFQIGEQVVHRVFGLGEIIKLDEKTIQGRTSSYYVVRISDITLWVLVNNAAGSSLRLPTPAGDFEEIFAILSGPGQPLSTDRLERKNQLAAQLKDGKLSSFCRIVRDLTFRRQSKKMNENDKDVLGLAKNLLLSEWAASLSIPIAQANLDLDHLLSKEDS